MRAQRYFSCLNVAFVFARVVFEICSSQNPFRSLFQNQEGSWFWNKLGHVVFNCPEKCVQAYSPQGIAPDWTHGRSSAVFFRFFFDAQELWFRLGSVTKEGVLIQGTSFRNQCVGCWRTLRSWNPDLKSSRNFAWFVDPRSVPVAWGSFFCVCYVSWVYVENGGTSCLWLPTSEWHFEPRLKSIDGTLVGELVVNGSRGTDALHPEQSETWRKLRCQHDMLWTIEMHWPAQAYHAHLHQLHP